MVPLLRLGSIAGDARAHIEAGRYFEAGKAQVEFETGLAADLTTTLSISEAGADLLSSLQGARRAPVPVYHYGSPPRRKPVQVLTGAALKSNDCVACVAARILQYLRGLDFEATRALLARRMCINLVKNPIDRSRALTEIRKALDINEGFVKTNFFIDPAPEGFYVMVFDYPPPMVPLFHRKGHVMLGRIQNTPAGVLRTIEDPQIDRLYFRVLEDQAAIHPEWSQHAPNLVGAYRVPLN
jgi:hypothetical protein